MRLLLIEDDPKIAAFIIKGMQAAGFAVDHTGNGREGLEMALAVEYDVGIVDLMLPEVDGLQVIEGIRRAGRSVPLIILSARDSVDDRVRGLQGGSDDYLAKPFAFTELLARVQALVRRASGGPVQTLLRLGDLEMDVIARRVTRAGCAIELQPREFSLLEYLLNNKERVVSKTMIMEHVWNFSFDPQTNVVEARISRLRNKIDRPFDTPLIHTVRGVGYVLKRP